MRALLKKIHIYIGLLNFSNIIVFGIAGLGGTFLGGSHRQAIPATQRYERFTPSAGADDAQIAREITGLIRMGLAEPPPDWAIHRDASGNLPLDFWTVNGTSTVIFKPRENLLSIEYRRNPLALFLDDLHTVTNLEQADWRMRLWALYNNFAIWSLIAMTVTGMYLWLSSRPGYGPALYASSAGAAIFLLLYLASR